MIMIILIVNSFIRSLHFVVLGAHTGHKTVPNVIKSAFDIRKIKVDNNDNYTLINDNDDYMFPVWRPVVHLDHHQIDG
jgi:hypothetical protein